MAKKKKSPVVESLKELGRLVILAIIPVLITYFAPIEDKVLWAALGTAALRVVDKFLHTAAPAGEAGGLTRI